MQRISIQAIKEMAEAVARAERADLEVTAVTPCESRGAYAEVLVTRRLPGGGRSQMLIGIERDLPIFDLRQTFSARLRARA